jgi:transcriptional regulator with XRE-family HTH domain
MSEVSTLSRVSEDRRYDERHAEAARLILRRFVEDSGSQQAAAQALGVRQATISRALTPAGQPTVKLLIALRQKIGLTLDEMLGLPPIALQGAGSSAEFMDRLRTLLHMLEAQGTTVQVQSRASSRPGRK